MGRSNGDPQLQQFALGYCQPFPDTGNFYAPGDGTLWLKTGVLVDGTAYGAQRFIDAQLAMPAAARSLLAAAPLATTTPSFLQSGKTIANGSFYSPVWTGSVWVAGGAAGIAYTSTDYVSWTQQSVTSSSALQFLTYGAGLVVGVTATGDVFTSPDGVTWTARGTATGSISNVIGIAFATGLFLVINTNNNTISGSADGITWVSRQAPPIGTLNSVTSNGTNIVISSSSATATTTDAIAWVTRGLSSMAFGYISSANGKLWATFASLPFIASSVDNGITWTLRPLPTSMTNGTVAWNGTVYSLIPSSGTQAYTSTDGISWASRTLPVSGNWQGASGSPCVVFGGSNFFIFNSGTQSGYYSSDGATWNPTTVFPSAAKTGALSYVNGLFVVVGVSTTNLSYSSNGIAWTENTTGLPNAYVWGQMLYTGSTYLCLANNATGSATGANLTSTMTARTTPVQFQNGVAGGGIYIGFTGVAGVVYSSTDAISWTLRSLPNGAVVNYNGVYINSTFVISYQPNSAILTSTDGINWLQRSSGFSSGYGVSYASSVYMLTTNATSVILVSSDALAWTSRSVVQSGVVMTYRHFAAGGNGLIVLIGACNNVLTSSDGGVTWNSWNLVFGDVTVAKSLTFANGIFAGVSGSGLTFISLLSPTTIGAPKAVTTSTSVTNVAIPFYLRIV